MSKLTAQNNHDAHFYAARQKYKYFTSNLLREYLSPSGDFTDIISMTTPLEAHILAAKAANILQGWLFEEFKQNII